jgi:hypothetical protein
MTLLLNGTTGVADVDGSASTPAIRGTDTNTGIFFPAADTIAFAEGGTEVARFDSNGNLGIGTSSPSAKAQSVSDTAPSSSGNMVGALMGSAGDGSQAIAMGASTGDYTWIQSAFRNNASVSAASLRFLMGATERMRINSGGDLFFNCTGRTGDAPNAAGGRITETNGNEKVRVAADTQVGFQFYSPSGGTAAPVGTITVNASSTSYNSSSDYRLKENILPMTGALAKVSALKPVTYTWKSTGEESQGFIAHELQEVVPDCVTGEKDAVDSEGNPQYQGIDTSFLVATLTAAIQEQQAIITDLKSRIEALEQA